MQEQINILVVDDEEGMRMTLAGILEDEGYNVVEAEDGYKGIEAAKNTKFQIAFVDMRMPGINGAETFKEIKKISPDTVVFIMTAYYDQDLLKETIRLGAQAVLYKPLDVDLILNLIQEDFSQPIVLVVDDEASTRETLKGVFEDKGYKVAIAESGRAAIDMVKHTHYDVMFMDVVMPEIDGFQAFEEIKIIAPRTKVILMTGHNIKGFVEKGIAQGAFACVTKTVEVAELLKLAVRAIKKKGEIE